MYNPDTTTGENTSYWLTEQTTQFTSLTTNLQVDVCIIGAGIAGISIAYQLVNAGKFVAIIDDGFVGSGETGRTTAHLANALDDRYFNIERLHGQENAVLAAQSHTEAINFIEAIIQQENIACDFKRVDGYLFLAPEHSKDLLQKECAAANRAGLNTVEFINNPAVKGFNHGPCLRFPQQAQFHPMKYLTQLAQIVAQKSGKIYTQTAAEQIIPGMPAQIKTNTGQTITADNIVIATNSPIYDKALLFSKQEPNRTYVIAAQIPKDSVEYALYWDTADPYHYIRLQPYDDEFDLLIIGGEDHRVGEHPADSNAPFAKLEVWARSHFPQLEKIIMQWSGQIQEPVDYLGFIGRMPSKEANLYVVTGDSGNGMTHGTIAALLITDLILGHPNPWKKLYSPTRSVLKNPKELLSHNIKAAGHYFEHLKPSEVNSVDEIKPGQGAIVRRGLKKIAVYRDENNQLHECSALCTHLQGVVKWNPVEKTWDCPVHGSRFAICGKVLNGPAIKPLDKI